MYSREVIILARENVSRLIKLVGGRENVLFNHETPRLGYQHKNKNKIINV